MAEKTFFFAGGGTGGHIYPAIAVAEKIKKLSPDAGIHFFASTRAVDKNILDKSLFSYSQLPATGLSLKPSALIKFFTNFSKSQKIATEKLLNSPNPVVIGTGGFVAAPVCKAAHKLKIPVMLINTDYIPGKANRFLARYSDRIFTQFTETADYLPKFAARIEAVGCPLREAFEKPDGAAAIKDLALDSQKKILLITGASSGSASINQTITSLLGELEKFADTWQIVHIAGAADFENVKAKYSAATIKNTVIAYYHDMPSLLCAAELIIGRSGAVSVAEYAAVAKPVICMPYPHHKDRHQYFNASPLVEKGTCIIVDDVPDAGDRAGWLMDELTPLLSGGDELKEMQNACLTLPKNTASDTIARYLLSL